MRRNKGAQFSSFDLFLDTMCNTFGGIVLIALLLALFPRSTGKSINANSDADKKLLRIEQTAEINRISNKLKHLRQVAQWMQNNQGHNTTSKFSESTFKDIRKKNKDLSKDLRDKKEELAEITRKIKQVNETINMCDLENKGIEENINNLKGKIKEYRENSQRQIRLPRLQQIQNKQTVFIALKDHKLYTVSDVSDEFSVNRGYDETEVRVEKGPGLEIVELLPSEGQLITEGSEVTGALREAVDNIDPQYEYISFAVYTNSFAEFNYVKKLFVKRGVKYNWSITHGTIRIVIAENVEHQ